MGTRYCTTAQVKTVAKSYSQDFNRQDSELDAQILEAIDEASADVRTILKPRYDIATIDATPPPDVINLTRIMSAKIIISQWAQVQGGSADALIDRLEKRIIFLKNVILDGGLLDDDGNQISTEIVSQVTSQAGDYGDLESLFEDGPRGFDIDEDTE